MFQDLMHKQADVLTENDYFILTFIEKNPSIAKNMTIIALSEACMTSKSTVLRLAQKLGFSGYSEFRYFIKEHSSQQKMLNNHMDKTRYDIDYTIELFEKMDTEPILKALKGAKTVYGYATGFGQQNALNELQRNLLTLRRGMVIIPSATEFEMVRDILGKEDLLIIISLSGEVNLLLNDLRRLKVHNVPTLSITSFQNNHLAEHTMYNLYYQASVYAQHHGQTFRSFIGLQVITDLIYKNYMEYVVVDEINYI